MKLKFDNKLHVASVISNSNWHEIQAHSLLQNTSAKQPSINAFLGARYSRSADSVTEIAREVYESGKDASKRLEAIFHGYGHKSVGDMADLFLCLENIPMLVAQRFFYSNPTHAGQERSTRYQDFSHPRFIKLPVEMLTKIKGVNQAKIKKLAEQYETIFLRYIKAYSELLPKSKDQLARYFKIEESDKNASGALTARAFDTARYFLPLGLQTSLGVVMSARAWSERIGYYRASKIATERELAELIFELLAPQGEIPEGYIPEADSLIRHTDANPTRNDSWEALRDILKADFTKNNVAVSPEMTENLSVDFDHTSTNDLFRNLELWQNPLAATNSPMLSEKTVREIGKVLFAKHNHHNQVGSIAQNGGIALEGFADYGSLKDLVRHRSLEKFVPLLEEGVDMQAELDRDPESCYFLCDYLHLPKFSKLKGEYQSKMNSIYREVKDWSKMAYLELPEDYAREFTRYLLPHGHATRYRFYGSIDDLQYTINLRTRNGGHISYRSLTYAWLKVLAQADPLWQPLLEKTPAVDPDSREQFVDRS